MTDEPWTPFEPALMPPALESGDGVKWESAWLNSRYQVLFRMVGGQSMGPPMGHLSIRRLDREAGRDWRDFQRIKNELCGTKAEGVELYPAESRLLDEANQYHVYVLHPVCGSFWFGAPVRFVGHPQQAAAMGARQRPFEKHHDAKGLPEIGPVWPSTFTPNEWLKPRS